MNWLNIVLISLLLKVTSSESEKEWNYDKLGPDYWKVKFSKECGIGEKQSPINIKTDEVVYSSKLKDINFINYDKPIIYEVINNGHTVVVNPKPKNARYTPSITGSNFGNKFTLKQFHFHWGYNDYQGSEHLIDYEKFPLELHLVHENDNSALAVVGFLFRLTNVDNPALEPLLEMIVENASEDYNDGGSSLSFALSSILPNKGIRHKFGYYRYTGSLTTPPCTEGIYWTVYDYKIGISPRQLNAFHQNQVKTNFRDPQNIYTRTVYSSRKNMGTYKQTK